MSEGNNATEPQVTVGLPSGLDKDAVIARKKALIAAGTEQLLAEKLAIDAESQHAARHAQIAKEQKDAKKGGK